MKKLPPEVRFKRKEMLIIVSWWVFWSFFIFKLEISGNIFFASEEVMNSKAYFFARTSGVIPALFGFLIGISISFFELYVFPNYKSRFSFLATFLIRTLIYLLTILFIADLTIYLYERNFNFADYSEAFHALYSLAYSPVFLRLVFYGLVISSSLNFIRLFRNRMGTGIFSKIILGRYHHPKEENRMFLFLDLDSSTSIAESLGHVKYSKLLQSCFSDLSVCLIQSSGDLYQFVGDEAVVTWRVDNKHEFLNGIELSYRFSKRLKAKSNYYQSHFGLVPHFTGALNAGMVTVAEVGGEPKTEIAYHGDVLNTAARLLEQAKLNNIPLIVAESVYQGLAGIIHHYNISYCGEMILRGKSDPLSYYTLNENILLG